MSTIADRARAFEWLRDLSLRPDAPVEAGIALEAWHDAVAQSLPVSAQRAVECTACLLQRVVPKAPPEGTP